MGNLVSSTGDIFGLRSLFSAQGKIWRPYRLKSLHFSKKQRYSTLFSGFLYLTSDFFFFTVHSFFTASRKYETTLFSPNHFIFVKIRKYKLIFTSFEEGSRKEREKREGATGQTEKIWRQITNCRRVSALNFPRLMIKILWIWSLKTRKIKCYFTCLQYIVSRLGRKLEFPMGAQNLSPHPTWRLCSQMKVKKGLLAMPKCI